MKLTIDNESKINIFIAIFQLLKNCTSFIRLEFDTEQLSVQGMDKSHVCLFHTIIKKEWFTFYDNESSAFYTIDSVSFHTILSRAQENNILVIKTNDQDTMEIELLCNEAVKGDYNRYFQLPLIEIDQDSFIIPDVEYEADFSLKTKKLHELTSQLILFGETLEITCSENGIDLFSNGDIGKMKVTIPMDDLSEFSIAEGETLKLSYSLHYIHKMCLTTKLSKDIEISISNDYPIRLKYDLGEESYLYFFVAPKITY